MENTKDDVFLIERDHHQQPFLRKKISLTIPVCILLIVVFLTSAFLVSIISLYWTEGTICYVNNNDGEIKPRPVYYSRPKRSPASKKSNLPCSNIQCCTTGLDPTAPWNQSRLPTNVYPDEYQLELDIFRLNQGEDDYAGTVDILIGVRSPTYDIILHADTLRYSDIIVSQRSSPDNIPIAIDCVIPFPNTQTVVIHLREQLQVDNFYDVRIAFSRALSVHGTGIFENQFNIDQFGIE
jgi:hypothetical protein